MIFVFVVITLLNIPTMQMYRRHKGLGTLTGINMVNEVSLGQMGYSKSKCY